MQQPTRLLHYHAIHEIQNLFITFCSIRLWWLSTAETLFMLMPHEAQNLIKSLCISSGFADNAAEYERWAINRFVVYSTAIIMTRN